jgi:hypothetical protein
VVSRDLDRHGLRRRRPSPDRPARPRTPARLPLGTRGRRRHRALSIIALVYTESFTPLPLLIAAAGLVGVYFTRYLRGGRGPVYVSLAIVVWLAFRASGVHPTLAGVAIALLVPVYRPSRTDVEHALELARTFRQSPNTEYARAAANSLRESISINERLQSAYARTSRASSFRCSPSPTRASC